MEESSEFIFALNETVADLWNRNAVSNRVVEASELRTQGEDGDDYCEGHSYEDEPVFRQSLCRLARPRAPEQVARWPDHVVLQSAWLVRDIFGCLDVEYLRQNVSLITSEEPLASVVYRLLPLTSFPRKLLATCLFPRYLHYRCVMSTNK